MKFGQVDNPEEIDFSLPPDHPDTADALKAGGDKPFEVYVGCAKWNRADLKGFYPRGTKDELTYYSTQFNSIELNATFYNTPNKEQVITWRDKTPQGFKFFPKLSNSISHFRRLLNVDEFVTGFCDSIVHFEDKLGTTFLQLHDNYKPKDYDRLETFVKDFPKAVPLAVELRNAEWFASKETAGQVFDLFKREGVTPVLVDSAGRRDLLHMRLTSSTAFVRYVGANHPSDYDRLDEWVERIAEWRATGLNSLAFFIHQNIEKESPLLAAHFIKKLNERLDLDLKTPQGRS